MAALREMLLNALVHRSYMGAVIQLRVYDHKISIWNEGVLPENLSIDSLKKHHVSRPRNPLIADVCFKAGYIDLWGRGTLKIFESCKAANLPEPDITEMDGGILVSLYKKKIDAQNLSKLGLNERQIRAVEYVKKNGSISNKIYQEINSVSKATATRDLLALSADFKHLAKSGSTGAGTEYSL